MKFLAVVTPPSIYHHPSLDEDAINVAATEAVGPSVPSVPILPPCFSLLKVSRTPPKFLFVFDHPNLHAGSQYPPHPNLLEWWYARRLVVISWRYFPIPDPFFRPILASILCQEAVELDAQVSLRSSSAATIVMVLGCVGGWVG